MTSYLKKITTYCTGFFFLWSQSALALKPEHQTHFNQFLKSTSVTQHPIKLKDLYEKFKESVPAEHKSEMDQFIKLNGDFVLPKMTVTKVKNQKNGEDIAIQMTTIKGNLVLTLKNDGPVFATLSGTENGEFKKTDLYHADISRGPAQFFAQLMGESKSVANDQWKFSVLSADQVNQLNESERKVYFHKLQQVLEVAEKLQNQYILNSTSTQQKRTSSLFELFVEEANAWGFGNLPSGRCIVAGYISEYETNIAANWRLNRTFCKLPKDYEVGKCAQSEVQCNPALYGAGVCIPLVGERVSQSATADCNAKVTAMDRYPTRINNRAFFDTVKENIELQIKDLKATCDKDIYPNAKLNSKKTEDQSTTCQALTTRVDEIMKITCEDLAKVRGFKCDREPASQQPVKPTVPAKPGAPAGSQQSGKPDGQKPGSGQTGTDQGGTDQRGQRPPPSSQQSGSTPGTDAKPSQPPQKQEPVAPKPPTKDEQNKICSLQQRLKSVDCASYKTLSVTCNQTEVYYCDCGGDKNVLSVVSGIPVRCKSNSESSSGQDRKSGSSGSWFSNFKLEPWMIWAGAGALGLGLWYYSSKQSVDKYYQMFNSTPVNPPVPPPQINTPGSIYRPAPSPGSTVR